MTKQEQIDNLEERIVALERNVAEWRAQASLWRKRAHDYEDAQMAAAAVEIASGNEP